VQELQHVPVKTAQSALTLRRSRALFVDHWQLNGPVRLLCCVVRLSEQRGPRPFPSSGVQDLSAGGLGPRCEDPARSAPVFQSEQMSDVAAQNNCHAFAELQHRGQDFRGTGLGPPPSISELRYRRVCPMPRSPSSVASWTLTSWLLSFAVAVLLFGIVSIALFDRMHVSL
jgi:hypothetical protein